MRKLKYALYFGGVFGDRGRVSRRARKLVESFALSGPFTKRQILSICKKLEKNFQPSFRNQRVKVSPVFYLDKSCFLDVDVFFSKKQVRSPFGKTIKFPNHLKGIWRKYQGDLFISTERAKDRKIEQRLKAEVNKNLKRLFSVLSQDRNPEKRATAAYLLSFSRKPQEASKLLLRGLDDNEHVVHNAAGWSLIKIVSSHRIEVPLKPVISLVHHPFPGCRNKGVVLLSYILKRGSKQDLLLVKRLSGQRLLEISKNNQPNYDFAKQILEELKKI